MAVVQPELDLEARGIWSQSGDWEEALLHDVHSWTRLVRWNKFQNVAGGQHGTRCQRWSPSGGDGLAAGRHEAIF